MLINFTCPSSIEVDDPVRIASDLTVAGITSAGHRDIIGSVVEHIDDETTCTVATKFNRRTQREAASELSVGPFVWGTLNKVVGWTPAGFATVTGGNSGPFVIAKATITGTGTENFTIAKATITGTVDETFNITENSNDTVAISVNGGATQTFTLTAGAARTAAEVATDFAAGTGFTASAAGTKVQFVAHTAGHTLAIVAVADDAYTTLGLTAAVVEGNDTVKVSVNGATAQTISLTAGTRTAAQVAADFSGATGFVASASTGHVVLTASTAGQTLEIVAVNCDAYTALGFTAGEVEAVDTISVTVGSGDPVVLSLTAGAARTAAQIAAEINAGIPDITATLSGQKIVLTCDALYTDFSIDAVDNDCYSILGFSTGDVEASDASHSPAAIGGVVIAQPEAASVTGTIAGPYLIANGSTDAFKVTIGSNSAETFDLTAGTARTAEQVVADLNATAANFIASMTYDGKVKITALQAWDDIEIESVSNDAYAVLGFSEAVTSASMTVQTLEY